MGNNPITNKRNITDNHEIKGSFDEKRASFKNTGNNPVFEKLAAEGGEDFFHYINWLGLAKEQNLMVLSSVHHYFYDFNDLKGVKTLVNLKKLNQISNLDSFLHAVYRVLPPKANLIGCFEDYRSLKGISAPFYQSTRLLNSFINMLDSKIDRIMSEKDVSRILKEHGFKVIDLTEINGLMYFSSQNVKRTAD